MKSPKTAIVVLAAGKGTRMKQAVPKALVPVGGLSMVLRVLRSVERANFGTKPIVVVGYKKNLVMKAVGNRARFAVQKNQLGTGHALATAMPSINKNTNQVIVIYGDHPFFTFKTIQELATLQRKTSAAITLATVVVSNFRGPRQVFLRYGHIVRDKSGKNIKSCVEYKDATRAEKAIKETNSGAYCFDAKWLSKNLRTLKTKNAQHEYYLTDLIGLAVSAGRRVVPLQLKNWREGFGVNSLAEVKIANRFVHDKFSV